MKNRAPVLLLLLALATSACSSLFTKGPAIPVEPSYVRVENRSTFDMTIYVIRDGAQRIRLGTANGNSSSRFRIPPDLIFGPTTLRFQADPIGSSRAGTSEEIVATPGDEVRLVIPPR